MSVQKLIDKSVKNMGAGMHPTVKAAAIELIRRAYAEGIYIFITQGHRTYEEQAAIYGQGRSSYVYKGKQYGQPGKSKVSNAKPGYSNHNFGVAIDYVLTNKEGTATTWEVNKDWKRVAAIAKKLGFAWGGDWTSFKDYPHLEMTGGLSTSQMRAGKKPNIKTSFTPIKGATEAPAAAPAPKKEEVKKMPNPNFDDAVKFVKAMGISDGSNRVDPASREEIFEMLFRFYKAIYPPDSLQPAPRFAEAVKWAQQNDISDGSNPTHPTTREQSIQMLFDLFNMIYPDADPSPRFTDALQWAKDNHITDGSKPAHPATREQAIQMIYKASTLKEESK